MTNRNG